MRNYYRKPDDWDELNELRRFRDNWMSQNEDGKLLVSEYYEIAPDIGEVVALVMSHNCFMDINTNFSRFIVNCFQPSWLDISCHTLDRDDYCYLAELQPERIAEYRRLNSDTKIRIHCFLHENRLQNIDQILRFMEYYKGCVDDFCFRLLITLDKPVESDLL
jgi:hypothetical protein